MSADLILKLSDTFLKKVSGKLILVLDDDKFRHELFEKSLGKDNVVHHVYGYDQAIKALDKYSPFDIIYYDHDLGDHGPSPNGYSGTVERTGADVALYMVKVLPEDKRPKLVVVHSWNYYGANRIALICKEAGIPVRREPFGESVRDTAQVWVKGQSGKWVLWEGVKPGDPIIHEPRKGGVETKIVPFGEDPNEQ